MNDSKKNLTNYSLLILCAGAKSYHENFCLIEPLLNIGNTLVIDRIKKRYSSINLKVYVAYNEKFNVLRKLESFKYFYFLNVGNTEGVIQTIDISLNHIKEKYVEILPITTIPDKEYEKKKAIYFGDKEIFKENWSSLKYSKYSKVKFFNKKDKKNNFENSYPFTGRISTSKLDLIEAIKSIPKNQKNDLINLAKILYSKYDYEIIHEKWFDLGHSVTYVETKNQDISSRAFNKLIFNSKKFTITKLSKKSLQLSNEKDYYKAIPKRYVRYFPNTFNEINKNNNDSLEMEYIAFPNLAEIFLFRKMGPNFWNKLINYINYIYEDFYKYSEPCVYENLSWLYSQKLLNRKNELEDLLKNKNKLNIGNIYEEKIILNRKIILPSLKNTIIEIFDFLKSFEKNRPLFFGHGDLCFNNILVEPISSSVKLIDPKAFRNPRNNQIGLVDPMYDLAKLNHSFSCLYDSIVNNLFILNKNANEIELFIIKPPNYDVANFYFKNIFGAKIIESETVRLLTSSLFLSMLPLHKENPNRVLALSIVGICLFNNININNLIIKL